MTDLDGTEEGELTPRESLPLWFERALVIAAAGVISFGGLGLLLAVLGDYRMLWAFALGGTGTVLGSAIAWPRRRAAASSRRRVVLPAIGMCVVALGFAAWNGVYAGHHVAIGRDPGVYAVTGKWIAEHGSLEVPTGAEWTGKGSNLTVETLGTYAEDGKRVEFQFNHLLPVLLAESDNLGSDSLMFRLPAVLGGLALCAVYTVGCRLVRRPWLVLAAVTALALSLPQLNVSRDTYSETSAEFLLWSGLWLLLVAYERRRAGVGLLAGFVIGGTVLSRIDALVYLIPLPIVAALVWLSMRSQNDRRSFSRACLAVVVGVVPTVVLGTLDARQRAGRYYFDLGNQVHELQVGVAVSVVVAVGAVLIWPQMSPRTPGFTTWVRGRRKGIGVVAGSAVAAGLLAAWALRPAVQHPRTSPVALIGGLQRAAGIPVDPSRAYAEDTLRWFTWYLGPIIVGLAILGAAVVVARICRRPESAPVLALSTAGFGSTLYLWNPSIAPDQIWAMRRFVPAAFPLFVLLAAYALGVIVPASVEATSRRSWVRPVLGIGAVGLMTFPLGTTLPVRNFQPQAGYLQAVKATCQATGPRAAILFVSGDAAAQEVSAAVRSWCNVPVATLTSAASSARLMQIADSWRDQGRTLWAVGSAPDLMAKSAPGLHPALVVSAVTGRELEMTINRPPQLYARGGVTIYAAKVSQ